MFTIFIFFVLIYYFKFDYVITIFLYTEKIYWGGKMRISTDVAKESATKSKQALFALKNPTNEKPLTSTKTKKSDSVAKHPTKKQKTNTAEIMRAKEWLQRGSSLLKKGAFKRAISLLERAYDIFYENRTDMDVLSLLETSTFYLGECHSKAENYRKASNYLEEALTLHFLHMACSAPGFTLEKSGLLDDDNYHQMIVSFIKVLRSYYSKQTIPHPELNTAALFDQFIKIKADRNLNAIKHALAFAYLHQGYSYQTEDAHERSRLFFTLTIGIARQLEDGEIDTALANFALGRSHMLQSNERLAIDFLRQAYDLLKRHIAKKESIDEPEAIELQIADVAKHLALCYKTERNYSLAKTYLKEAYDIYSRYTPDDENYIVTALGLGLCEYFTSGVAAADYYFSEVIRYFDSIKNSPLDVDVAFATVGIWLKKQDATFINSEPLKLIIKFHHDWKANNSAYEVHYAEKQNVRRFPRKAPTSKKKSPAALPVKSVDSKSTDTVKMDIDTDSKITSSNRKHPALRRFHSLPNLHDSMWKVPKTSSGSLPTTTPQTLRMHSMIND